MLLIPFFTRLAQSEIVSSCLLLISKHYYIFRDESKYLSQLEESGWLENIRRLLEISTAIASEIENEGSAVVVAYDDGVDRTSQVLIVIGNVS